MKKRAFFLLLLLLIPLTSILSQEIALKTNALSWATTTINLGAEFKISPRQPGQISCIKDGVFYPITAKWADS